MVALWLMGLVGCDQLTGGGTPAEPACDLAYDNLAGRTFVYLEAMPDKSERPNPIARVKFVEDGGELSAKYTVASLSDVYTFPCSMKGDGDEAQLFCAEESKPVDWCQALLVADATCSKKALKKMGADQTDDELNAAIKEAKENVRKYRDTESWNHFKLNNNNLGNKLQGRLYVQIVPERCRLNIGDYYWTIFNGKEIEDTNPVGQNPFVESDDEDWLFEHCTEGGNLPGIESDTLPDDLSTIPARGRVYKRDKDVWFHYLGEKHVKAEDGCTYNYDSWANWKPAEKGVSVSVVDGKVMWKAKHNFSGGVTPLGMGDRQVAVYTMKRKKTCGGKEEVLDLICEGSLLE